MDSFVELEARQARILQRITEVEAFVQAQQLSSLHLSPAPSDDSSGPSSGRAETTISRLAAILRAGGVHDFLFKRVPFDYYDLPLESRRDILGAPSVEHLCKSIVLVNTQAQASVIDCSNHNNSKYYIVVVQYVARLNAESIKNFLYSLNDKKIPKKKFNCHVALITFEQDAVENRDIDDGKKYRNVLSKTAGLLASERRYAKKENMILHTWAAFLDSVRLAPEEESMKLTGYVHNAVTCIGMETEIPVILDEAIVKLEPDFFWLGGGEVDLKLGIRTPQFISAIKPFVVSCSS